MGQIPPGRGESRGDLMASPGASNKCIARELLHFGLWAEREKESNQLPGTDWERKASWLLSPQGKA